MDTSQSNFIDNYLSTHFPEKGMLNEKHPPGMEDWVKSNKSRFKKEYGSEWEQYLYATAWKIHDKKSE